MATNGIIRLSKNTANKLNLYYHCHYNSRSISKYITANNSDKSTNDRGMQTTARVTIEYFMRKKGLFNDQVNLKQLNASLVDANMANELRVGKQLTLDIAPMYANIDKDFLLEKEVIALAEAATQLDVFIQMLKYEYSCNIKYNVYVFVTQKRRRIGDPMLGHLKKDDECSEEAARVADAMAETASSSVDSSLTHNSKIKNAMKELKKNILNKTESKQVGVVKKLIYGTLGLLFLLGLGMVIYFYILLVSMGNLERLKDSAYMRRSLLATVVEQFESYRSVALGNESASTSFEPNRVTAMQESISTLLRETKDNEYVFQDRLASYRIESIDEFVLSPGTNYVEISINSQIQYNRRGLVVTIMQILAAVNRLVNEVPISSLQTSFIRDVYARNPRKNESLTQTDKDTHFVLINGLYNMLNASHNIIDRIESESSDLLNLSRLVLEICHYIVWGIIGLILIVSIPLLSKVQHGKLTILRYFAEVPKKRITTIVEESNRKAVDEENQQHEKEENKNVSLELEQAPQPDIAEDLLFTKEMRKNSAQKPHKHSSHIVRHSAQVGYMPVAGHTEETDDLRAGQNATIKDSVIHDEGHIETWFQEQRKKKFSEFKARIGWDFLLFAVSMIIVGVYQFGLRQYLIQRYNFAEGNNALIRTLHCRWSYLVGILAYLPACTPDYEIYPLGSPVPYFGVMFNGTLNNEDTLDRLQTSHTGNQEDTLRILRNFLSSYYCGEILNRGIISKDHYTMCTTINNGLLQYGIRHTIFYIATEFKAIYQNVTNSRLQASDNSLLFDKLIIDRILIPTFRYIHCCLLFLYPTILLSLLLLNEP